MKTEYSITNDAGEITSEIDTPSRVVERIRETQQSSGVVYGGGQRYAWSRNRPEDAVVVLEFTRNDCVVEQIEIPAKGWKDFQALAIRRDEDPKEWLTCLLGQAMVDGIELRTMCHFIFSGRNFEE